MPTTKTRTTGPWTAKTKDDATGGKRGKRGNREGAIYQRHSDGLWCAAVLQDTGKRKVLYGKTREEVADKLLAAMSDIRQGLPIPGQRLTLGRYLEQWLEDAARPKVRASTYRSYEQLIRVHIAPALGRHQITKLTPQQVQAFLNEKSREGLSPRSVQYLHAVLRHALNRALKWGLVARNVALLVDPPRVERHEVSCPPALVPPAP